jgi:hypothetical protein
VPVPRLRPASAPYMQGWIGGLGAWLMDVHPTVFISRSPQPSPAPCLTCSTTACAECVACKHVLPGQQVFEEVMQTPEGGQSTVGTPCCAGA